MCFSRLVLANFHVGLLGFEGLLVFLCLCF
jgi:hypothetical protein